MNTIRFLEENDVVAIHQAIIENSPFKEEMGFAPNTSLESALHRVYNHITYNAENDLHDLAALYGIALCKGHVFLAGNKRTAMVSMGAFLLLNGVILTAENAEIEEMMVEIAEDRIDHEAFTAWLKNNTAEADT